VGGQRHAPADLSPAKTRYLLYRRQATCIKHSKILKFELSVWKKQIYRILRVLTRAEFNDDPLETKYFAINTKNKDVLTVITPLIKQIVCR